MKLSFGPPCTRHVFTLILVAGTAFAQPPSTTFQASSSSTSAQSSSSASSSAPTTNLSSAESAQAAVEKDTLRKAAELGFRAYTSDGETRYCRTETMVGTRFRQKTCYDAQGIENLIRSQQSVATQLRTTGCSGGSCGGK